MVVDSLKTRKKLTLKDRARMGMYPRGRALV
jgi:hypothetical protein